MREIKFRAFAKDENRIIDNIVFHEFEDINTQFKDDELIFMQYTGLKDKKGIEIYEGDIVIEKSYPFYGDASEIIDSNQKCDELNYVGVIVWDNGYYVDLKVVSNRVRGSSIGQSLYDYEELEIIGNIYENPELLGNK